MDRVVIGLTGMNAAGKGTVAAYLKTKGYKVMSLSDTIRDELKAKGIPETRESLVRMGNDLRKEHGPGALASLMLKRIEESDSSQIVVDSIRNPAEVGLLRTLPGFILFGIDAPISQRFERAMARGRAESASSLEEFRAQERKEMSDDTHGQQLHNCIRMIDLLIVNDGSIDALHEKVDIVLSGYSRL